MMPSELLPFLQSEYSSLKAEQATRIFVRDNALYSILLVLAGIVTLAFTGSSAHILFLLAVPPTIACLISIYISQDIMISRIRRFIQQELLTVLSESVITAPDALQREAIKTQLFAWEATHRMRTTSRSFRKISTLGLLILVLGGSCVVSLIATCRTATTSGGLLAVMWWFGVILTVGIIVSLAATTEL